MKNISVFIDRLLLHAISWIGSPLHGLPEHLGVYSLPDFREAGSGQQRSAPGQMRFTRA